MKLKRAGKKILAAFLCACMLAGVLPLAPSSTAQAIGESITYTFKRLDWNPITTYTYEKTGGDWCYHSYSESTWEDAKLDGDSNGTLNMTADNNGNGATRFNFDGKDNRWVALKIKVPAAGIYSASGKYAAYYQHGINEYYIIPVDGEMSEKAITEKLTEDTSIGVIDGYITWSESKVLKYDQLATFRDVTIPEAGEYLLVIKGTGEKNSGPDSAYWNFFSSLTLKKTDDYVKPGMIKKTYTFNRLDWETPLTDYTYEFTKGDWRFHSYSKSTWEDADTTVSSGTLTTMGNGTDGALKCDFAGRTDRWVAIEIKVPTAGVYSASGTYAVYWNHGINEYYIIPADDATSEEDITEQLTEENSIGRLENVYAGSLTYGKTATFGDVTIPEAGEYLLVIKGTGERDASNTYGDYCYFSSLTLLQTDYYEAPEKPSNFGEHYAYMTKDEDKYILTVIGGIKDIDGYSEVGFVVSVNGEEITQGSQNVYETINYNGTAIDKTKIGTDVTHLFYQTFEIDEADMQSLSFKAYAKGTETEFGSVYEVPLLNN